MAVPELAGPATSVAARAVIAGEPWHITAPADLAQVVRVAVGHLPTWSVAPDPMTLDLRAAPMDTASPAPTSGTVQTRTGNVVRQVFPGVQLRYDATRAQAAVVLHGDAVGTAIRTEVLARMIMLRAASRGLVALHGAAVGGNGRYWVIPAVGGTGKSTATAAAVVAGCQVLGDDLLLWDPTNGDLHSVSGTLRLTPDATARFDNSELAAAGVTNLWDRHDGKVVMRIPAVSLRARGTLAGLLLIGAEAPPPTPAGALRALSSSLFQFTRIGVDAGPAARAIADLSRHVQIRSLRRDPDLRRWGLTLARFAEGSP